MKIFLIGFMGCGKSKIGKSLAKTFHFSFTDSDSYIEKKTSKSIKYIFNKKGEQYFRDLEREFLQDVILKENTVIATGGGTPCFHNNMQIILDNGISVYLKMEAKNLAERLCKEKNKRPLIDKISCNKLDEFISSKLTEREEFYLKATHIINAKKVNIDTLRNLILG